MKCHCIITAIELLDTNVKIRNYWLLLKKLRMNSFHTIYSILLLLLFLLCRQGKQIMEQDRDMIKIWELTPSRECRKWNLQRKDRK